MLPGVSHRAIRLEPAFEDRSSVRALVEIAGPYIPLARTAQTEAEQEASGRPAVSFVPPWFRRDLVTDGVVHVDGAELILHNPPFREAAAAVFGGDSVVEPTTVYVNVMAPTPFPFVAHVDIPIFRRASRANCPVWLLHQMLRSGLFEDQRIKLATAVTWFYEGTGGEFHYWPDGPDAESQVEAPPFGNVAVVADNERVFHGVASVGEREKAHPGSLTLDAECDHVGDQWIIRDPDQVAAHDESSVRITISWKAEIFADEADRDASRSGSDELPLGMIVDRFAADLERRGVSATTPEDPLHDVRWIDLLAETYPLPAPPIPSGS